MGVAVPNSIDLSSTDKENGVVQSPEEPDAGALFAGHRAPGVLITTLQALVTFYSYNLLSVVLEHHAQLGKRQLRFRDMARDILGPRWGKYFVGPLQIAICYGAVIGCILLGGQSLKFIYLLYNQSGKMQLYQFIIIFGAVPLFLAQIPSFHSLRHINLASLLLCLAYSACVTAGSIHIGNFKNAPIKDYSIKGSKENHILGAINGISIIATTTYFSVAISGYWAFVNQSKPTVLSNFMVEKRPLLPTWFLLVTNIFTRMQLVTVTVLTCNQQINYLKNGLQTQRWISSLRVMSSQDCFSRSLSVIIATTFAAIVPFFGDIMALFGAFGVIPLDFILPMVFYNLTFKPSKKGIVFWGNTLIAVASSALVAIGAVASVRQIILDAKTYNLFANM
ncbi:hypothetical protein CRYUN_Cryun05aG0185900 [Craigia yunnanensis]